MRLRAPPGGGDPTVAGKVYARQDDGSYHVDDAAAVRVLIESHGFTDADAPAPIDELADAIVRSIRRNPTP
jgi:hypothetical protein